MQLLYFFYDINKTNMKFTIYEKETKDILA